MICFIKKSESDALSDKLSSGSYDNTKFKQMTDAEQEQILASLGFSAERVGD